MDKGEDQEIGYDIDNEENYCITSTTEKIWRS